MKIRTLILAACAAIIAGCDNKTLLEHQTDPDRADFAEEVIIAPPPAAPAGGGTTGAQAAVPAQPGAAPAEMITGIWSFTTPPTVTRVERKNGDIHQFSLYNGRPAPTDTPFMVVTVSRSRQSIAESEPDTYKVSGQRDYSMNGGLVHEWIGMTSSGAGFSELLIRRPGAAGATGDVCHAMALARTNEEQQLAVSILASIVWKPTQ